VRRGRLSFCFLGEYDVNKNNDANELFCNVKKPPVFLRIHKALIFLCFSFGVLILFVSSISAAGVPAAASPGAVQPDIETKRPANTSDLNFRYGSGAVKEAGKRRSLSPDVPRMQVKGFVFKGVVERSEYGIFLADIEKMGQQLIDDYPEGLAIDDFRELTDQIRRYYRERGLFLARAYIPEQNITDSRVTINILEGLLEDVTLDGSDLYSVDTLKKPFTELINRPIEYRSIESALLYVTDSPGIQLQALFGPGEETGGSILKLGTTREQRFNTSLWLDNYGSEYTGNYRLRLSSTINNVSNSADYLTVTLLKTFNPSNSIYYALDYERPLNMWNSYLGFDVSNNGFEVGQEFEALGIKGDSRVIGVRLRKMFMRQRDRNLFASFALHQKNANSEQNGTNIGEDRLTVASLALHYNGDSEWLLRGNHAAEMRYSQGLPDILGAAGSESSGISSGGDFSKINLRYTHKYLLQKNQVVEIQYRGQFSSDSLSSIEQSVLGGPNSVRGYPVSEVLFDSSTIINLEWQARSAQIEEELAWLKNFQFGAYYDFATGKRNQALSNERETASLRSMGGFVEFQPFGKFQARFDLAFPQGGDEPVNGDSFQFYFNLGRIF